MGAPLFSGGNVGALSPAPAQSAWRPNVSPNLGQQQASPLASPLGSYYNPSSSQQGDFLNQLGSWYNLQRAAGAPQEQAINNNITEYQKQIGLAQANQQTETGNINQDCANQLAQLGLSRQGLGIQQGALGRQEVLTPQQHALTLADLAQQEQQAQYGAGVQNRQLTSQSVGQGALQSQGARQGFSDIGQQLAFQMSGIGRARTGENLSFNERQAQLQDQQKSLNLAAKGLDLSGTELQQRTQRALQQLGLQTALSVSDVTKAINDANAGRFNPIQSLIGSIYQVAGIRPVAGG